jgi:hypothetical protein
MAVGRWLRVVLVALAAGSVSCGLPSDPPMEPTADSSPAPASDSSPSPTPVSPLPSPVLGAPGSGATPTPEATPTPAATPLPPSTPSAGCSLPPSNPVNPTCTDEAGRLLAAVDAAITRVTQTRPALFDFKDNRCENCYLVLDVKAFSSAVQSELAARGICTFNNFEELGAKDSNASSEQFDILLASGHIRRGAGVYRGICRPAIF